ncbi:TGF-beta-activated kinase 1 and MAP3K7-binding protein 1 isoform X5 [Ursus arctos]|nr:TGF-beta-activated kinase 1 and MAP3K7-binding protein 1 isoform X5 [Ursus arctos]
MVLRGRPSMWWRGASWSPSMMRWLRRQASSPSCQRVSLSTSCLLSIRRSSKDSRRWRGRFQEEPWLSWRSFSTASSTSPMSTWLSCSNSPAGTNRALLCKSTVDGLQVTQLNVDHTTENEDELFRLSQLGLDAGKIKQVGVICGQESTRRIGDYKVKYGYTDIDLLSAAKSKPIIAEPEIHGAQPLDGVTGFLVLMSEGLYKALEAAHGPGQANQEIAAMIDTEFAKQTSLDAVAQAVVDRVKRIHGDTFASGGERAKFCPRHEDMTLLVRNFGYPLGEMSQPTPSPAPAAGGRVYPVSVPYSSAQSTSKTSVTLSLVMPSQGQLVNGAHSASTLDEATPTLTNQSPTLTLQSTATHTQSSSSSSDGGLFRSRPAHSLPPGEDGRVEPYVDFAEFYRLWSVDHGEQSVMTAP